MHRRPTTLQWLAIGLAIWLAAVVFWGFRPLHDTVPVGTDFSQAPPAAASIEFECAKPLSTQHRIDPLPALAAQPAGNEPLAYRHLPCEETHRESRIIFGLDLAVFVAAAAGIAAVARRGKRAADHSATGEPALTALR
jgi:hypothetical protein